MKAIITFVFNSGFVGNNDPTIKAELKNKLHPDLSDHQLDPYIENYVVVYFKIRNRQIEVIDMESSDRALMTIIKNDLRSLEIKQRYTENKVYKYKLIIQKK